MTKPSRIRIALYAALCWTASCNPVVDDAVTALGGETGSVRPGPLHRPGQRCLLCHDGKLGDPPEFSIAGTVFQRPADKLGARGATVVLKNADGATRNVVTNAAGNFYLSPGEFAPKYPLQVEVHYDGETATMHSVIGREGACAGCHADPNGPSSPGHVYATLEDGGMPP